MSKHTLGPWKIDARPFNAHGMFHISGGDYIVAQAMGQTSSCESEASANARLIAAAPDMRQALETITRRLREASHMTFDEISRELNYCDDIARAAIAKAEGQPTEGR